MNILAHTFHEINQLGEPNEAWGGKNFRNLINRGDVYLASESSKQMQMITILHRFKGCHFTSVFQTRSLRPLLRHHDDHLPASPRLFHQPFGHLLPCILCFLLQALRRILTDVLFLQKGSKQ